MPEQKAIKSFIEASHNKLFNPYHFTNSIKVAGVIPADMMHRAAVGWFRLLEIDYRYGIGDPLSSEIGARVVHTIFDDYEELPTYNPMRGFEGDGANTNPTWKKYEPSHTPAFIQRGVDQ